jgi:glutaredoxin
MLDFTHVDGQDSGKITLFALSTCVWCRKTRKLLDDLGVAYDFIYVDLLEGEARQEAIAEVKKYSSSVSFPLTVFDDSDSIQGCKEEQIRERIGRP